MHSCQLTVVGYKQPLAKTIVPGKVRYHSLMSELDRSGLLSELSQACSIRKGLAEGQRGLPQSATLGFDAVPTPFSGRGPSTMSW